MKTARVFLIFFATLGLGSNLIAQDAGVPDSWRAFLVNSEALPLEVALTLEVHSGVVTGTHAWPNGLGGPVRGQSDDNTLSLTFVTPVPGCPMAFTLSVTLTGDAGAGTWTASDCSGTEKGALSMSKTEGLSDSFKCYYQHEARHRTTGVRFVMIKVTRPPTKSRLTFGALSGLVKKSTNCSGWGLKISGKMTLRR